MPKLNRPKLKLNRKISSPESPTKLNRKTIPFWKKEEYKYFPLYLTTWEDDGGVTQTIQYVCCHKNGFRRIPLEVCIKGIFYFSPKAKECRKCWSLGGGIKYPPEFLNTPKKNVLPEALKMLTLSQQKKTKGKLMEVEGEKDFGV